MQTRAVIAVLAATATFVACSDNSAPVKPGAAQSGYIGTWEHAGEIPGESGATDNMLLVIRQDGSVSYLRCVDHEHSHRYTSLPDAYIKTLTDKELVIASKVLFVRITDDLPLRGQPHTEADESYFNVDGLELRKLKPGESSTSAGWKCRNERTTS